MTRVHKDQTWVNTMCASTCRKTRVSTCCHLAHASTCLLHMRARACYTCEHVLATRASTCFLHVRARYLFVRARLLFKNVRPGQLKTPCSVYLCTFSSKGIFILGTFQTTKWWVGCLRLLVVNMGDLEYVNFCRYLLSLS